jgi:hypothetical protein
MERYTAEQIAKYAEDLDGKANRTAINKMFMEQDESNLWPIWVGSTQLSEQLKGRNSLFVNQDVI